MKNIIVKILVYVTKCINNKYQYVLQSSIKI